MQSHGHDPNRTSPFPYAVLLLAGGRARRLPGKLGRRGADGRSVLATTLAGILDAHPHPPARVLLVGARPIDDTDVAYADPRVHLVADQVPFEGPARAIASVIQLITEPVVIVLAADAPHGASAIPGLLTALVADIDTQAAVLVTDRVQHLCSAYRTTALLRTSAHAIRAADLSAGLQVVEVADVWGASRDIDTADDAQELGFDGPSAAD